MAKIENISVVIPTMGRPLTLKRTLETMLKSTVLPKQVVIVDQSTELAHRREIAGYKDLFSNEGKVEYTYFYQEQASLTKARNNGARLATEEILVCCDDDVDVNGDTFEKVRELMSDEKMAMIAGLDSNLNLGKRNAGGYFWGRKSYKKRKIGHVTKSMYGVFPLAFQKETKTEWAMGFFFVVRKSLLEKWKLGWDEKLISYAYAEDLDFSYAYAKKCEEEQLKCIFSTDVIVTHLQSQEYRIPSQKFTYMYVLNREYLSYKHFKSAWSRFLTRWSNLGMFFWRIVKRQRPWQLLKAQMLCDKYRKKLKKGEIPVELLK